MKKYLILLCLVNVYAMEEKVAVGSSSESSSCFTADTTLMLPSEGEISLLEFQPPLKEVSRASIMLMLKEGKRISMDQLVEEGMKVKKVGRRCSKSADVKLERFANNQPAQGLPLLQKRRSFSSLTQKSVPSSGEGSPSRMKKWGEPFGKFTGGLKLKKMLKHKVG